MGYPYRIPKYDLLTPTEVERIQGASLLILSETGVKVPSSRMIELAAAHGAEVDRGKQIIRFTADIVLEAVSSAGKQHVLYGRNRSKTVEFGCGMFNFNGSSGQFQICDAPGTTRRKPTLEDLRSAICLGEQLKTINIVGAMVVPSDVPQDIVDVLTFRELLVSTSRPFTAWIFDGRTARIIVEMMQLVGIVLVQFVRSGHPVSYGGIAYIMDMKTGTISFGSHEQALMAAALTQCGKSYDFPVYSNTGLSDSKGLDAQYGIESGATLALGALVRSDIFGHLGICGAENVLERAVRKKKELLSKERETLIDIKLE